MTEAGKRALRDLANRRWLSLAVLAFGLFALSAHAAPAQARPLVTGISGIGEYQADVFGEARSSGAGMVRLGLYWDAIAPRQQPASWEPENPADPHYNWSYIDLGVTEAVNAGLTPVLLVDGAPPWAQRCKSPSGIQASEMCDPDPAALEAFAKAAAARYGGHFAGLPRVQYWEGLNEPNLSLFFFPQFNTAGKPLSPYLYRHLINAFYAGIKSVDPANLVLAAGLGPIAVPKWTIGPMRFARLLLCMQGVKNPHPTKGNCEGGVHFDIFDIHPYTSGGPSHEGGVNDVELGDLGKLAPLLKAADRAGRIKGSGRHTRALDHRVLLGLAAARSGRPADEHLCRWTAEAMHRAWSAGVTPLLLVQHQGRPLRSQPPLQRNATGGPLFPRGDVSQDQPKEVFYAFRFPFVSYPTKKGLSFWGRTPSSEAGKVSIQLWKGGQWRTAVSANADKVGIFHGLTKRSYGRNRRGQVRAVFKGQPSVAFSMRPVRDFHQPPFG